MIPSRRLIAWAALPLLLAVVDFVLRLLAVDSVWSRGWSAALAVLAIVAGLDALLAARLVAPNVTRRVPSNLSQGVWQSIVLELSARDGRQLAARVIDGVPGTFALRHLPRAVVVPPGEVARVPYDVCPNVRGEFAIGPVALRVRSPLGLWERSMTAGAVTSVRVFPDFSWLRGTLALVGEQRMQRAGVRLSRRRGEGLEFHQLREYRPGDVQRQIDWKASARRPTLVSREYQEERDQQVLMVLDTGARMRAMDGDLSHFDHVLRAMLLLSFVALRQGDAVGLLTFGGNTRTLPMQRGAGGVNALLRAVYDLDTTAVASDYLGVAEEIRRRQRRRALVVLLTNAQEDDADLLPALEMLRERHIVLVTSLREQVLTRVAGERARTLDDALMAAGVASALVARARAADAVRRAGHTMLDCAPMELPVRLVHDYYGLKRSGRL